MKITLHHKPNPAREMWVDAFKAECKKLGVPIEFLHDELVADYYFKLLPANVAAKMARERFKP